MTFSFNNALTSSLDKVRLRIGDTISTDVLLANETIQALLDTSPSIDSTVVQAARAILAAESRGAYDRTVISITTARGQRLTALQEVIATAMANVNKGGRIAVTGTSRDEAVTLNSDTDYRKKAFNNGQNSGRSPLAPDAINLTEWPDQ